MRWAYSCFPATKNKRQCEWVRTILLFFFADGTWLLSRTASHIHHPPIYLSIWSDLAGFQSDAGPWTVLAADALVEDEGTYKPDFSAHAGSEHMRCVRISKASVDTITSLSRQEQEAHEISSEVKVDIVDAAEANGGGGGSSRSVGNSSALSGSDRNSSSSPGPPGVGPLG